MKSREHEVGVLRSRGATNKQIILMSSIEGGLLGVFGGLITTSILALSTSIIFNIPITTLFSLIIPKNNPLGYYGPTFILSVFGGGFIGASINLKVIYNLLNCPILDNLNRSKKWNQLSITSQKNKNTGIITIILLIIILSSFSILFLNFILPPGFFQPLQYLLEIIYMGGAFLSPFVLVILPLIFIRLITSNLNLIVKSFTRLFNNFSPFLAELFNYASKQEMRVVKQVVLITILSLTFTILPISLVENLQQHSEELIKAEVGSDMFFEDYYEDFPSNCTEEVVSALPENSQICQIAYFRVVNQNREIWLAGINTSCYTSVVELKSYSTHSTSLSKLISTLETLKSNECIIDDSLVKEGYEIDDTLMADVYPTIIKNSSEDLLFRCKVIGMKDFLPGLDDPGSNSVGIIINIDLIADFLEYYSFHKYSFRMRYLIQVPTTISDFNEISMSLKMNFGFDITIKSTQNTDDTNGVLLPLFSSFIFVLRSEAALTTFFLVLSITVIFYLAFSQQKRLIGNYRSRGITSSDLMFLILCQTFTLFIFSVFVGFFISLVNGFLLTKTSLEFLNPTTVPIPSDFPYITYIFLSISIFILLLIASIIILKNMQKQSIIDQIRLTNK